MKKKKHFFQLSNNLHWENGKYIHQVKVINNKYETRKKREKFFNSYKKIFTYLGQLISSNHGRYPYRRDSCNIGLHLYLYVAKKNKISN